MYQAISNWEAPPSQASFWQRSIIPRKTANKKRTQMQDHSQTEQSAQRLLVTSIYRTIAAYSIILVFIGMCGHHFFTHREEFAFLADLSLSNLLTASLCIVMALLAGMFQLKPFFDHYRLPVRFLELGALSMTSSDRKSVV
jgi:hypothetical protein